MKLGNKEIPPPGPQGDYRGSCAVCLHNTDTGLAFAGEAEFAASGLVYLGIPQGDAAGMIEIFIEKTGADPDDMLMAAQICSDCAGAVGMPVGVLPEVPLFGQSGVA